MSTRHTQNGLRFRPDRGVPALKEETPAHRRLLTHTHPLAHAIHTLTHRTAPTPKAQPTPDHTHARARHHSLVPPQPRHDVRHRADVRALAKARSRAGPAVAWTWRQHATERDRHVATQHARHQVGPRGPRPSGRALACSHHLCGSERRVQGRQRASSAALRRGHRHTEGGVHVRVCARTHVCACVHVRTRMDLDCECRVGERTGEAWGRRGTGCLRDVHAHRMSCLHKGRGVMGREEGGSRRPSLVQLHALTLFSPYTVQPLHCSDRAASMKRDRKGGKGG